MQAQMRTGPQLRWLSALVLGVLIGTFLVRGLRQAQENANSAAYDQRSYLFLGLNLREGRDLTDGKRHPALPALLSLIAERDWPYFTRAKLLNLGLGVVCILLVYAIGRRWFGPRIGLLAAGCLSLSPPFLHVSARVMAEPLLLALTLLSWYLMAQALTGQEPRATWYAAGAGLSAGLAYFTKGTALQMLPSFVLVAIVLYRLAALRQRRLWVFVAVWVLAWLPLMLFNIQEYGNPLYNYNYKHEIFLDSPTERHFADVSEAPTLQTYLREHTAADIAFRMWFGLKEVTRILFRALAPVEPDLLIGGPAEAAWIAAWLALLAFLATRWRHVAPHIPRVWLPAFLLFGAMLVASLIPLGWFVQASNVGPRFIVVFQPLIYVLLIGYLQAWVRGWPNAGARRLVGPAANATLGLMVALSLVGAGRDVRAINWNLVAVDREANARGQAVLEWLASGTPYGTKILWGPSYTLPNWIYERRLSLKDVPSKAHTWEAVVASAQERELAYALLDWEMIQRREDAFAPYFGYDYPWVTIKSLPPNWALLLPYDGIPANWVVLRLLDAVPVEHPLETRLSDAVALTGYETYQPPQQPDRAYVTVYLRASSRIEQPLGMSFRVMGADGATVAEGGGPLLEGRLPVELWTPGADIGQRQMLNVPPGLAAGSYDVVVTLYRLDAASGSAPEGEPLLLPQALPLNVPDPDAP